MNMDEYISEYAETLEEAIDYAQNNATFAVKNVDNYLYYLADVYSTSVIPGGCLGDL
ncbi:zinc- and pH-regulated surface protein [Saccharomyces pastorianus]|nr:zinc- and pH-regulated surface protein [Saccharomyces pastorianus]